MSTLALRETEHPSASPFGRMLEQIAHCLRLGCVIRIEHTPIMSPRFSPWEIWGTPACYNGDMQQLQDELEQCCVQHAQHFVRLNIEDYSCHSRFSFVIQEPDNIS